jgi:predicted nucleotide-binding protein (sugar kinase/HSP70/actin superfamily)
MVGTKKHRLEGRKLYIPHMDFGAARIMAAAFRSIGIDAEPSPDSDPRTLSLGKKFTSGEECYPEIVTIGDFLKVTERSDFRPEKTAFFMPTAPGPCRFGQYSQFQRKVFDDLGFEEIMILSPTSETGYEEFGEHAGQFIRIAWWAVVASDILRKMLLKTRPYEVRAGETDEVHDRALTRVGRALEVEGESLDRKMEKLRRSLRESRDEYRLVEVEDAVPRPLIGVVGEIFCRLNAFSNEELIRKIEAHGGEAWLSGVAGWVWYTNTEQRWRIQRSMKGLDRWKALFQTTLKRFVQRRDEHSLMEPFREDFVGYEEPEVEEILANSHPYLPPEKVSGESVLNIGEIICFHDKGADGAIDISPFTCMHGGLGEDMYQNVSDDHDGIPIRSFTCDETQSDVDDNVGIFMKLAETYMRRKMVKRERVSHFRGMPDRVAV